MTGTAPKRTRLSALIVNYSSGSLARACVESLIADWARAGRPAECLEIVVVDNASPVDQSEALAQIEDLGATVVRSSENLGYARGMNLAYEHTLGEPGDVMAVLNPDLYFLPGSLDQLVEFLVQNPECGAVDPAASMDPGGVLRIPPNLLPTPGSTVKVNLAQWKPRFARSYAKARLAEYVPWWEAEGPLRTEMLSGCCIFMRRDTVTRLGGEPLDPAFPLYFEDTDLWRRLRGLGLELVHLGSAKVVHHWSRSSGVGQQYAGEPARRFAIGERLYFERYHGRLGAKFVTAANRWGAKLSGGGSPAIHDEIEVAGEFAEPPTFEWGTERPFLAELGMTPNWLVSVGVLGTGAGWSFPAQAWEWMFEGVYYLRFLDAETHELLGAYGFMKTTPSRTEGIRTEEVELLWPDATSAANSTEVPGASA